MGAAVRSISEIVADLRSSTGELVKAKEATLNDSKDSRGASIEAKRIKGAVLPDKSIDQPETKYLREALRAAVQLEFATIPPYLTALWSIIDQAHPIARSIRAVVHEEMLHLSLVCNLLVGLGEEPRLTGEVVPIYPTQLPGGVQVDLVLRIEGYGASALDMFMEVERPEQPIPIEGEQQGPFDHCDVTVGEFYAAILAGFEALSDMGELALRADRQIAGPFVWFIMTDIAHVREAIGLIMAQGEGAVGVPFTRYPQYLSHYYRFKSMAMGVELNWDESSKQLRKGKAFSAPSVYTLAPAPKHGYGLSAPASMRNAGEKFDQTYSAMLRLLELSWQDSGDKSFIRALELMFDLAELARVMMQTPTADGRGHAPPFRYLA